MALKILSLYRHQCTMCTGVISQAPLITLQTPRTMVVKTIGVYFGIVIEGLPYITGQNVSQNQWRMQ